MTTDFDATRPIGTERRCPKCGLRTAWTGSNWDHCATGTFGLPSCPPRIERCDNCGQLVTDSDSGAWIHVGGIYSCPSRLPGLNAQVNGRWYP
jgi:predicted RNA-binding Zn-ribbon protein involved in translation (DUF1610 family)